MCAPPSVRRERGIGPRAAHLRSSSADPPDGAALRVLFVSWTDLAAKNHRSRWHDRKVERAIPAPRRIRCIQRCLEENWWRRRESKRHRLDESSVQSETIWCMESQKCEGLKRAGSSK